MQLGAFLPPSLSPPDGFHRRGGELVAGHHGPLGHVLSLGQQDVGGIKAQLFEFLVHGVPPVFDQKVRGLVPIGHSTKNPRRLQSVFKLFQVS